MNKETFNTVVAAAKERAANSPAWVRCLDKASKMLASGELVATVLASGVLVTSPNGSYLVTAGHCPCAARTKHCYHRCAARIATLLEEAELAEAAARRCDAIIEDIKTIAADIQSSPRAELIADIRRVGGPNLADALVRRFKCSDLNFFADDVLRDIRLAIAA